MVEVGTNTATTVRPYDLTVAYRIYPKVSKTPAMFADNKYRLSEFCLRSFKESLGGLKVKMLVLLDGCPAEYAELFKQYFAPEDLELIPLPSVGNLPTFGKQIDLLLEQNYSEAVYFAEDDYFYLPDQFPLMLDFLRNQPEAHFVTPYDHPDYYTTSTHSYEKRSVTYGGKEWYAVASTCLTFLTTKTTLVKTAAIFRSYTKKNTDVALWFSLTKFYLYNPIKLITSLKDQTPLIDTWWRAWFHGWREISGGKKWLLWVPKPSIGTHMEKDLVARGIDWPTIFQQAAAQMPSPPVKTTS